MKSPTNHVEEKPPVVASLGFTAVMTLISLAMLVKSFVVAQRAGFSSGITDLVIWAFMAVTWTVALVLRYRHRNHLKRQNPGPNQSAV